LEAHVLSLNNMRDPSRDLKAGQVFKLPDLPRSAQTYAAPKPSVLSQTRTSIATNWDAQLQAFAEQPKMSTGSPNTAQTELQVRFLPHAALATLKIPDPATPLSTLI